MSATIIHQLSTNNNTNNLYYKGRTFVTVDGDNAKIGGHVIFQDENSVKIYLSLFPLHHTDTTLFDSFPLEKSKKFLFQLTPELPLTFSSHISIFYLIYIQNSMYHA